MSSKARSSAAMNGDKPLRKRKKKMRSPSPSPVTEPTSIMSLPNDLLLSCLARVSRLYYPTLSFVCKTFRSIVASPELYETRSRLNCTEKCIYLGLRVPKDPNTHWSTLYREPNRHVTSKSSGYLLVQIPSPKGLLPGRVNVIAVGSNIYKIGGSTNSYSSFVSVLDCRSHRWHQAPSMRVARSSASTVSRVDGKIYVAGGCKEDINSLYWIEVFDPKTQTWTYPCIEFQDSNLGHIDGQIGLRGVLKFGSNFCVYKEGNWNNIGVDRHLYLAIDSRSFINSSCCVIDDVLFIWDDRVFKWYDSKVSLWKELNGIEGLPDFRDRGFCNMVDFGGKIAVLWDQCLNRRPCKGNRYFGVLRLASKSATEMRFGVRLSGLIVCLEPTHWAGCAVRMFFLLLFDEISTHDNRLDRHMCTS